MKQKLHKELLEDLKWLNREIIQSITMFFRKSDDGFYLFNEPIYEVQTSGENQSTVTGLRLVKNQIMILSDDELCAEDVLMLEYFSGSDYDLLEILFRLETKAYLYNEIEISTQLVRDWLNSLDKEGQEDVRIQTGTDEEDGSFFNQVRILYDEEISRWISLGHHLKIGFKKGDRFQLLQNEPFNHIFKQTIFTVSSLSDTGLIYSKENSFPLISFTPAQVRFLK